MILPRLVFLDVGLGEIDVAELTFGITLGLIVEVRRGWIAAFTAGRDRLGPHVIAKLDDGQEAVAARPVLLLGAVERPRSKRRQRSPARRGEPDRDARL